MTQNMLELQRLRPHIERALSYSDDTHLYDDVAEMVSADRAVLWSGPDSVIVTETILDPRRKSLHFFLAAGQMAELEIMTPHILEFGRMEGCTKATLIGRKGWQRSFLSRTGWSPSPLVMMEKTL